MNNMILNHFHHHKILIKNHRKLSIFLLLISFVLLFITLKFYFNFIANGTNLSDALISGTIFLILTILAFLTK